MPPLQKPIDRSFASTPLIASDWVSSLDTKPLTTAENSTPICRRFSDFPLNQGCRIDFKWFRITTAQIHTHNKFKKKYKTSSSLNHAVQFLFSNYSRNTITSSNLMANSILLRIRKNCRLICSCPLFSSSHVCVCVFIEESNRNPNLSWQIVHIKAKESTAEKWCGNEWKKIPSTTNHIRYSISLQTFFSYFRCLMRFVDNNFTMYFWYTVHLALYMLV